MWYPKTITIDVNYPKIMYIDGVRYYFSKEYTMYAMYVNDYGIRECFTPYQIRDILNNKTNKIVEGMTWN